MSSEQERSVSSAGFRWFDAWPILIVLLVFCAFLVVLLLTSSPSDRSLTARGQFGDSFGVLSALFNGLAFAGLIITITLQSRELRLQREELTATRGEMRGQKEQLEYQSFALAKQNFEGTFFRLTQMIDDRASQLPDPAPHDLAKRGRSGFIRHVEQLRRVENGAFADPALSRERARVVYRGWFDSAASELASYFQLILATLSFVDQSQVAVDKRLYSSLLRAALSPAERCLLFYHAVLGMPDASLEKLLRNYDVLSPDEGLILDCHREWL